ncbi:uncharacterized protein LOC123266249 [Cotesia glomerata]|uniref:uncharacterized protein LOC123266249 n=1 Tax=Cotesia glomerata TaxID=32391 RepID=UPI001D01D0E8|nr:uncharacterized protein LOC123266249 [Cotesia glomerata]
MCVETTKEARACQLLVSFSFSPILLGNLRLSSLLVSFSVRALSSCSGRFAAAAAAAAAAAGSALLMVDADDDDDGGGSSAVAAATPLLCSKTVNSFSSGSFQGQTTDYYIRCTTYYKQNTPADFVVKKIHT